MIQCLHDRIFYKLCYDSTVKCIYHTLDFEDADFIEFLPQRVEEYGYDPEFGACLQKRFRCILRGEVQIDRDELDRRGREVWDPKTPNLWDAEPPDTLDPDPPTVHRGPRQPYVYNPRAVKMYENGCSIRTIARVLGLSKFNVSRMVQQSRAADQMFLSFFRDMKDEGLL